MRLPRNPADASIISILFFLSQSAATANFDCENIRVDGKDFDLKELGGARSVLHHYHHHETTYTIDICKPLEKIKDALASEQCPSGTRVCGIKRTAMDGGDILHEPIPIAGELKKEGGKDLDAKWERLKTFSSHSDFGKEGLRVEFNGGFRHLGNRKRYQKAIIEFICDKTRDGLEHLYDSEYKYEKRVKREGKDGADNIEDPNSPSLEFVALDEKKGDVDLLRLNWRTKYACEDWKDQQDTSNADQWGFFTWFIVIAFLFTAAYLIFGAWLNYNRDGARRWALLPNNDRIRDAIHLFKNWMERVSNPRRRSESKGSHLVI